MFYGNTYANINDLEELSLNLFETCQKVNVLQKKVNEQLSLANINNNASDIKLLKSFKSQIKESFQSLEMIFTTLINYEYEYCLNKEDVSCRKYDMASRKKFLKESYNFYKKNSLVIASKLNVPQNDIDNLIKSIKDHLLKLNKFEQDINHGPKF